MLTKIKPITATELALRRQEANRYFSDLVDSMSMNRPVDWKRYLEEQWEEAPEKIKIAEPAGPDLRPELLLLEEAA